MSRPVPYLASRTLTVVKPIDTSGARRIVNLGLNESWLGTPPGVVEAIKVSAETVHRYSDPGCKLMRVAIGQQFGLDPARIVCGNGSEELLDAVGRVYARPGDEILFPAYSFLQFAIAVQGVDQAIIAVHLLGQGGTDAHAEALPQRPTGHAHARQPFMGGGMPLQA